MFKITANLATPIALGRTYLTLDAVLFGVLRDLLEFGASGLDPLASIPLERTHEGLYAASRALFVNPVQMPTITVGGIRPVLDMTDAESFIQPRRKGKLAKIVTTRGETKAHLSRYTLTACEAVYWYAEGDLGRSVRLLEKTSGIGALRKDGYGRIASIETEEGLEGSPFVGDRGEILRPIPCKVAPRLGIDTGKTTIDTWKPPYWDRENATECVVPLS